jgi:hypothetical protein
MDISPTAARYVLQALCGLADSPSPWLPAEMLAGLRRHHPGNHRNRPRTTSAARPTRPRAPALRAARKHRCVRFAPSRRTQPGKTCATGRGCLPMRDWCSLCRARENSCANRAVMFGINFGVSPGSTRGAIVVLLLVALTATVLWIVYRITNR